MSIQFHLILLLLCFSVIHAGSIAKGGKSSSTVSLTKKSKGLRESNNAAALITDLIAAAASIPPTKSSDDAANKLSAYRTILGGLLTHLTLGSLYCWGNFQSYAPKTLKFFDGKDHPGAQPDSMLVLPLTLVAQCCTLPIGSMITAKIGSRTTMLLGSTLLALGVFLSSYARTLAEFLATYSVMVGAGIGIAYTAPMIAGWKWLPQSKGFVSGAVLTGFGAGGFFFNLIGSKIVNPMGLDAINGKFPESVYRNFPVMLRKLSVIYIILAYAGSFLVVEPKIAAPLKGAKPVSVLGVSLQDSLKTKQFWLIWFMIISSASAGLNVASIYKSFAVTGPALTGDGFQSLVGGMGALFNGFGRLFWGSFSDKFGFKQSFMLLTSAQALLHFVYPLSLSSKPAFLVATCLCFFCLAGNFALIPPATQRIFGPKNGALIYGMVYSAFGVASVGGMILSKILVSQFGWDGVFKILGSTSLFATILTTFLHPLESLPSSTV